MLFYDVSLEKRVMFQFCGMSHTPHRHFPAVSQGAYRSYVGELSDPVFESQNC